MSSLDMVVIGGGAWGSALALACSLAGVKTALFCRNPDHAQMICQSGQNARYLPNIALLPPVREVSADPQILQKASTFILAIPAQALSEFLTQFSAALPQGAEIILAAKGLLQQSGGRLSEKLHEFLPACRVGILSGPSFAGELARTLPTAVTIASSDMSQAHHWAKRLSSPFLRLYPTDDVLGVELSGAYKNVLAIGCGITQGSGLGENARAALITRGLAELARLVVAQGGRRETVMGLSGVGDIMLSCHSPTSRNFSYGIDLARKAPGAVLAPGRLVEGVASAAAFAKLSTALGLALPIAQAIAAIIAGQAPIAEQMSALLARPLPSHESL
jgi:glycerol-3-phosphate dehydrogenase (NAD(P)+)